MNLVEAPLVCGIVLSTFLPKCKFNVLPFNIANNMLSYIAFVIHSSDKSFTSLIEV